MRFGSYALATSAVLALGACGLTNVTTVGLKTPEYRTSDSNYAMNGRDVFVVVQGSGYGTDQTTFRQAVLDNMQRVRGGMNTRFTATPKNNYNSDYKVVMLFNGPNTAQAGELCRQPTHYATVPATITDGETRVFATFCRFDAPLTEVSGRASGISTVHDARFASLIQQTMTDLFPSSDERPLRDSGDITIP